MKVGDLVWLPPSRLANSKVKPTGVGLIIKLHRDAPRWWLVRWAGDGSEESLNERWLEVINESR